MLTGRCLIYGPVIAPGMTTRPGSGRMFRVNESAALNPGAVTLNAGLPSAKAVMLNEDEPVMVIVTRVGSFTPTAMDSTAEPSVALTMND